MHCSATDTPVGLWTDSDHRPVAESGESPLDTQRSGACWAGISRGGYHWHLSRGGHLLALVSQLDGVTT
jgi:hypothetical protein